MSAWQSVALIAVNGLVMLGVIIGLIIKYNKGE